MLERRVDLRPEPALSRGGAPADVPEARACQDRREHSLRAGAHPRFHAKVVGISFAVGACMELFMVKTGFYEKVTAIEAERRGAVGTPGVGQVPSGETSRVNATPRAMDAMLREFGRRRTRRANRARSAPPPDVASTLGALGPDGLDLDEMITATETVTPNSIPHMPSVPTRRRRWTNLAEPPRGVAAWTSKRAPRASPRAPCAVLPGASRSVRCSRGMIASSITARRPAATRMSASSPYGVKSKSRSSRGRDRRHRDRGRDDQGARALASAERVALPRSSRRGR